MLLSVPPNAHKTTKQPKTEADTRTGNLPVGNFPVTETTILNSFLDIHLAYSFVSSLSSHQTPLSSSLPRLYKSAVHQFGGHPHALGYHILLCKGDFWSISERDSLRRGD